MHARFIAARLLALAAASSILAAAAGSAFAAALPPFGTYEGTTSQGYPMGFTFGLGWDGATPTITNFHDEETVTCAVTGALSYPGMGGFYATVDATGAFQAHFPGVQGDVTIAGAVAGASSFSGTSRNVMSQLVLTDPLGAERCEPAGVVSWTANLVPEGQATQAPSSRLAGAPFVQAPLRPGTL